MERVVVSWVCRVEEREAKSVSRQTLLPPHTTQPEEGEGEERGRGEREKGKTRIIFNTVKKITRLKPSCLLSQIEPCPTSYLSQFHLLSQPADHTSNSSPHILKVGVAWGVVNLGQSVVEVLWHEG